MYKTYMFLLVLFTREEKNMCSCINVHEFTGEENLFTNEKKKSVCLCTNVHVFTSVYSHTKKKVYDHE